MIVAFNHIEQALLRRTDVLPASDEVRDCRITGRTRRQAGCPTPCCGLVARAPLVRDHLHRAGLRAEADIRNEKINYKVREHSVTKVPVILVVGKREVEETSVNMRRLGSRDQVSMPLDEATATLVDETMPPDRRRTLEG